MSEFNMDKFCEVADLQKKLRVVVSGRDSLEFLGTEDDCQIYIDNSQSRVEKYNTNFEIIDIDEFGSRKYNQGEFDETYRQWEV